MLSDADCIGWLPIIWVMPVYLFFVGSRMGLLESRNFGISLLRHLILLLCLCLPIIMWQKALIQGLGKLTTLKMPSDIHAAAPSRFYSFNSMCLDKSFVKDISYLAIEMGKKGAKDKLVLRATFAAPVVDSSNDAQDSVASIFIFNKYEERQEINDKNNPRLGWINSDKLAAFVIAKRLDFIKSMKGAVFYERIGLPDLPNDVVETQNSIKFIKYEPPIYLLPRQGLYKNRNTGFFVATSVFLVCLLLSLVLFKFSNLYQMEEDELNELVAECNPLRRLRRFVESTLERVQNLFQ